MKSEMTVEDLISGLEQLYGRTLDLPIKGNIAKDSPEYHLWSIEQYVRSTRYKEMARSNLFHSLAGALQRGETIDYDTVR